MYVFRMEGDANAKKVIDAKIEDVVFDRYASFAHSPHMVREYALLQSTQIHMCIMRQDSERNQVRFSERYETSRRVFSIHRRLNIQRL
jgi:hypothetical protein